jgi:hypothetical protein
MATTRNSTAYAQLHVNKYMGLPVQTHGRVVPILFAHTVVSGEVGGASAGVQDKVNLCVIPALATVIGLDFMCENLWASAGVNGTIQIGDSGDDDRYMQAIEAYTATTGNPIVSEWATTKPVGAGVLAFAGFHYRPTIDTIVVATYKAANPTVGKILRGVIRVIPST